MSSGGVSSPSFSVTSCSGSSAGAGPPFHCRLVPPWTAAPGSGPASHGVRAGAGTGAATEKQPIKQ